MMLARCARGRGEPSLQPCAQAKSDLGVEAWAATAGSEVGRSARPGPYRATWGQSCAFTLRLVDSRRARKFAATGGAGCWFRRVDLAP
jgi:hypothetical protein